MKITKNSQIRTHFLKNSACNGTNTPRGTHHSSQDIQVTSRCRPTLHSIAKHLFFTPYDFYTVYFKYENMVSSPKK